MFYSETLDLILLVIDSDLSTARSDLHFELMLRKQTEAKFCISVIKHGASLNLSNEQWFNFFKKIPNILFKHERFLMNTLTQQQREELNFE